MQADAASYVADLASHGAHVDYCVFDVFDGENKGTSMHVYMIFPSTFFTQNTHLSSIPEPSSLNAVPPMLLDPKGQFMKDLAAVLDPAHGTLFVNLHGDPDKKATTPFFMSPVAGLGDPGCVLGPLAFPLLSLYMYIIHLYVCTCI